MLLHNTLLHQEYSFKIIRWHSPETFFFPADKHNSSTCLCFSSCTVPVYLCSFIICLNKAIVPLLQGAQRQRNVTLSLYSFLGCLQLSDSFLTSPIAGFHECASHLKINVFLRILAAIQRWRFRAPQCVLSDGTGLWPARTWKIQLEHEEFPPQSSKTWTQALNKNHQV